MQENASREPAWKHQPGIGARGLKVPDISSDEASLAEGLDEGQDTIASLGNAMRIHIEFDLLEISSLVSRIRFWVRRASR